MPESAIKFGSYEASKRALARIEGHDESSQISGVSRFIAGGMGGIIAQFAVYPIDTLKLYVRLPISTTKAFVRGLILR